MVAKVGVRGAEDLCSNVLHELGEEEGRNIYMGVIRWSCTVWAASDSVGAIDVECSNHVCASVHHTAPAVTLPILSENNLCNF
jgi:hypothetical protein